MSSTTSFDDTYLQRLQRDCLQGMEAVRNLDETSDPEDIRILVAISEQFASNSSLEQAVEQELSLPVIGTVLEQMQRRRTPPSRKRGGWGTLSRSSTALSRIGWPMLRRAVTVSTIATSCRL
jgi:hypothetical protein